MEGASGGVVTDLTLLRTLDKCLYEFLRSDVVQSLLPGEERRQTVRGEGADRWRVER